MKLQNHDVRFTPKSGHRSAGGKVRFVPILLQKSVAGLFGQ
jgi:hypothetical protein